MTINKNRDKKFIIAVTIVFLVGLIFGTICGIGVGEIIKAPEKAAVRPGSLISDLKGMAKVPMYPNHPISLWDKDKGRYSSCRIIEELYGEREEKPAVTLSEMDSDYILLVFESPLCPVCFAMHEWLRDIRRMFAKKDMEIVIINPPALSETSAEMAVNNIRNYLSASSEEVKSDYITQDRNNFRHVSLRPEDQGRAVSELGITDIPYMVLLDRSLNIIYTKTGYPSGASEEVQAFMKAPKALFKEIRRELDAKEGKALE